MTSKKGFASMDPERRKAIARKGGSSTKPENRSFAKDKSLARNAGRLGGLASVAAKRAKKEAANGQ